MACACSATNVGMHACNIFLAASPAKLEACMATAIIFLISAICGVCGAGLAVAVAMIVWPESKTQTEV